MECTICNSSLQDKYVCSNCFSSTLNEILKNFRNFNQSISKPRIDIQSEIRNTSFATKEVPASILIENLEEKINEKQNKYKNLITLIKETKDDLNNRNTKIMKAEKNVKDFIASVEKLNERHYKKMHEFKNKGYKGKINELRGDVFKKIIGFAHIKNNISTEKAKINSEESKSMNSDNSKNSTHEEFKFQPSNENEDSFVEFFNGTLKFPLLTTVTIMKWLRRDRKLTHDTILYKNLSNPPSTEDLDKLNAVIGYFAMILSNLEEFLYIQFPYKIEHQSSTSKIYLDSNTKYPLFVADYQNVDSFEKGLELLNLNIIHLCFLQGIIVSRNNKFNFMHNLLTITNHPSPGNIGYQIYYIPEEINENRNQINKDLKILNNSNMYNKTENYYINYKKQICPIFGQFQDNDKSSFGTDTNVHKKWPRGYLEGSYIPNYITQIMKNLNSR